MTSLTASLALILLLFMQSGLAVREVASPIRPGNAIGHGLTVVEVRLNRLSQPVTRVIRGEAPFIEPAIKALESWSYFPAADTKAAFTSVSFFFRPARAEAIKLELAPEQLVLDKNHASVPATIIDPGYPAICLGSGVVTMEVRIDRSGKVTSVKTLSGPPAFVEDAELAVKRWTFTPAERDGRPVTSTSYVVISFVRPLT
jgi:TonB family protein